MVRPRILNRKIAAVSLIVLAFVLGCVTARAGQPHMQAALAALRTARQELAAASPSKGGHRERAMQLVDKAIVQVEEGIEYAR